MMAKLGVIEGFYGQPWSTLSREYWAKFLSLVEGSYYIYAPKKDSRLRKEWKLPWKKEDLDFFLQLRTIFKKHHVSFGLGLSPFGISNIHNFDDDVLREKIEHIKELDLDYLGIFFDDMNVHQDMAHLQVEFIHYIKHHLQVKLLFCPSYYSDDPILDKVFGPRPSQYIDFLGDHLDKDISIYWTGPKVISPEINGDHLLEISKRLKRKPMIWDNFFANDGPKNCKYLMLKPYTGRNKNIDHEIESITLNLMNQPFLSSVLYRSVFNVFNGDSPEDSLSKGLHELHSFELINFLKKNMNLFLLKGLDHFDESLKSQMLRELILIKNQTLSPDTKFLVEKVVDELMSFIKGHYIVDSDCLTD